MKYLPNIDNLARDAALVAGNIVASNAIFRTDTAPKGGGGIMSMQGPYTGQQDTQVDVKIVDLAAGSTPSVSAPVFVGVGNGEISGLTVAPATSAQTFTVTLEDLGTQTRAAYAPFQSVTLRAATAGPGGNSITLSVDAGSLVDTATEYALQEDLVAGQNEYHGDRWNFGAATLNPDGTIPADAPRIRFGVDPQVYRAWRKYVGGKYVYGFSPAPVRDVSRGTRVYSVSGSRTVTISDGVATDTLTGIVTLYDCLSQIRDNATLVEVDGVIVQDMMPSGMGATDLSVWTRPYVTHITRDGTEYVKRAEVHIAPGMDAPTELLKLTCATTDGAVWDVYGDVSGILPRMVVGEAYAEGDYSITLMPPENAPQTSPEARIDAEFIPVGRGDGEGLPGVCFEDLVLGAKARDGEYEFVYTPRPPEACDCSEGDLTGSPDERCLGLDDGTLEMAEEHDLRRFQRLAGKVRELIGSNTLPLQDVDPLDVDWIRTTSKILAGGLAQISHGTVVPPAWVAATAYKVDEIVSAGNGYRYAATVAGTSGGTAPAWPTTEGSTVTDGGVTWECIGLVAYAMWDAAFGQWSLEAAQLIGIAGGGSTINKSFAWQANYAAPAGLGFVRPTLANRNGCLYGLHHLTGTTPYETGSTEPAWVTTPNTQISDGDYVYQLARQYWSQQHNYTQGTLILPGDERGWVALNDGVSGVQEPDWWAAADGVDLIDGTVAWKQVSATGVVDPGPRDQFYDRYRSMMEEVLLAAGIVPANFDVAGSAGGACWQDHEDSGFWWAYSGDRVPTYLPVQTGHYYHSAAQDRDENGDPVIASTQEFGFGPRVGCPGRLKEGDVIRITISGAGAGGNNGYQQGDTITAQVTRTGPLEFGGGQTGNDTLTWSVVGSVDGRLTDYALLTTAPNAYSDGGLGFQIAPGGLDFALGDRFTFAVEGGHVQWRRDGGAWSAAVEIGTVTVGDGLTLEFAGGTAPSWAVGDQWTFKAEAINGPDALRQPTDARCTWTGSTIIDITPTGTESVTGVLLGAHSIPDDAVIKLQASDDNWATTALDESVTWRAGSIWHALATAATHAAWRITVDKGGSLQWLWLGQPLTLALPTGVAEVGMLTKRYSLPGLTRRGGLGARVEHSALSDGAVNNLLAALEHAGLHDDARVGIVPHDNGADAGLARYAAETLEVADEFGFQPDGSQQLLRVSLELEAVA